MEKREKAYNNLLKKKRCKHQYIWSDIDVQNKEFSCLVHISRKCDCMGKEEHCIDAVKK